MSPVPKLKCRTSALLAKSKLNDEKQVEVVCRVAQKNDGTLPAKALKLELDAAAKSEKQRNQKAPAAPQAPQTDGVDIQAIAEPFVAIRKQIDDLSRALTALSKMPNGLWLRLESGKPESGVRSPIREAVKTLRAFLTNATPFAECSCGGKKTCGACMGLGWVTEGVLA
jgi:hypothetical protein